RPFTPSMTCTVPVPARFLLCPATPGTVTARPASLHAADRSVAPPEGLSTLGADPVGFPPSRQPATGPPGSYPDGTHTRSRRRAYLRIRSSGSTTSETLGTRRGSRRSRRFPAAASIRVDAIQRLSSGRQWVHSVPLL